MICGCRRRENGTWDCAGRSASECAAVEDAVAAGKVRRFSPGEREVDLVELTWQKTAAEKRKRGTGRARKRACPAP